MSNAPDFFDQEKKHDTQPAESFAPPPPAAPPPAPEAAEPFPPTFKLHGEYYTLQSVDRDWPVRVCSVLRYAQEPKDVDMSAASEFRSRALNASPGAVYPIRPGGQRMLIYVASQGQEEKFRSIQREMATVLDGVSAGSAYPYMLILLDDLSKTQRAVEERLGDAFHLPSPTDDLPEERETLPPKAPTQPEIKKQSRSHRRRESKKAVEASREVETPPIPDWLKAVKAEHLAAESSDESGAFEAKLPKAKTTPPVETAQPAAATPAMPPPAPENVDEAVAWLEGLAARRGAPQEELMTKPEERPAALPAWAHETPETPPDVPPPPAQETALVDDEIPDWLKTPEAEAMETPVAESSAASAAKTPSGSKLVILTLGERRYALVNRVATGATTIVWQARQLTRLPDEQNCQLLKPGPDTYRQLLQEQPAAYPDSGEGSWAAIKLARPACEKILEQELKALIRLGEVALRVEYPGRGPSWPPDFPCLVVEWVAGRSLAEWGAFNEKDGLEVCYRLADLLFTLRSRAPEIIPTDGLKADNLFIESDGRGGYKVRLVDWGLYSENEASFLEKTLIRFGEVMTRIFAPGLNFSVNRQTDTASFERLAAGQPDDPGVRQWDALTYGTRDLIRRVLLREGFEGSATAIGRALLDAIKVQRERWNEPAPLRRARLESGAARLIWLEIAAAKGEALLPQDEEDYNGKLLRGALSDLDRAGRDLSALVLLRTTVRRRPQDSRFRWALLAHEIARQSGVPQAYQYFRLGRVLEALEAKEYEVARAVWDARRGYFSAPDHISEKAGQLALALTYRIEILQKADAAYQSLQGDFRIEDADAALASLRQLNNDAARLEQDILPWPDALCEQSLARLQEAVDQFNARFGQYEYAAERPDPFSAARRQRFDYLTGRALRLDDIARQSTQDDLALKALALYDLCADQFPDLWQEQIEKLETHCSDLRCWGRDRHVRAARADLQDGKDDAYVSVRRSLQAARRFDLDSSEASATSLVLRALQRAGESLVEGRFQQAQVEIEMAQEVSWPEIQPTLESWRRAVRLREQLERASRDQCLWPKDVKTALEVIQLTVPVYNQADSLDPVPASLKGQLAKWRLHANGLWEAAYLTLHAHVEEWRRLIESGQRYNRPLQAQQTIQCLEMAWQSLPRDGPLPADDALARLDRSLDWLQRVAQALDQYEQAESHVKAREYCPAIESASAAHQAIRFQEPGEIEEKAVQNLRAEVADLVAIHLRPWWEHVYREACSASIPTALAQGFTRFEDTAKGSFSGPLAEMGNLFLRRGDEARQGVQQALAYLLAPESGQNLAEFALALSRLRPGDCKYWFYQPESMAALVAKERFDVAVEMVGANMEKPDEFDPDCRVRAALAQVLQGYWLEAYQAHKGILAQTIESATEWVRNEPDLTRLADVFLATLAAPDARAGTHYVVSMAIVEAVQARDAERAERFAARWASVRPQEYGAIHREVEGLLRVLSREKLRQAAIAMFSPGQATLTFARRDNLKCFIQLSRWRNAWQKLADALRLAPTGMQVMVLALWPVILSPALIAAGLIGGLVYVFLRIFG